MSHEALMRLPARSLTLSALLFLVTFFLYISVLAPQRSSAGNGVPASPANGASPQPVDTALDELDALLDILIDPFDFAAKGNRVAAFANLAAVLPDHGFTTRERFNALVKKEFTWWESDHRETAFLERGGDTGIVVCVGSKDTPLAGHLVRTLPNVLQSHLPIEIAYAGDDDLSKKDQAALSSLTSGLEFVNLLDHFDQSVAGLRDGKFAMKPFAVIASRFRKTILVDADVIFLQNPEKVFEMHDGIDTTVTLFYHDRAYQIQGKSRAAWVRALLGERRPSPYLENSLFWKEDLWQEMESGVRLDEHEGIRKKETYSHVLGDKETYWIACELSNTPYYFQPDYAGLIGTLEPDLTSKMCSAHILHMDHTGDIPFWFNGGLLLNKALAGKDLVKLTQCITDGVTWQDQPTWRYNGDEYWCAAGKPAITLTQMKMANIVDQIMQEAQKVGEAFSC